MQWLLHFLDALQNQGHNLPDFGFFLKTFIVYLRLIDNSHELIYSLLQMNCLVVDDDELIRIDLERKIDATPFLRLVASCSSAMEAAAVIAKEKVDLVFLDILMPEISGLQFMKSLPGKRPEIILVTSEKDFAAEAFEYNVIDYLVKPVSNERFLQAAIKANEASKKTEPQEEKSSRLFAKINGQLIKIPTEAILYVEAKADYISVHMDDGQKHLVHSSMKAMEQSLPVAWFFRVHNSFIVSLDKITRIEDNMLVINTRLIPVSRSRVKPLMARLNLIS